jgi:uncharacterized cysteine cluster protein YcgN (CxxCxxCC family)
LQIGQNMKKFLMIFVLVDNCLTNLASRLFPRRWQLEGTCRQCGRCCQEIHLKMTPGQMRSKLFTKLAVSWISWLFGFILLAVDEENQSLVFTCKYLTAAGRCGNYPWRANVCRNYPLVDYFDEPKFLPGCGFRAKLRS